MMCGAPAAVKEPSLTGWDVWLKALFVPAPVPVPVPDPGLRERDRVRERFREANLTPAGLVRVAGEDRPRFFRLPGLQRGRGEIQSAALEREGEGESDFLSPQELERQAVDGIGDVRDL